MCHCQSRQQRFHPLSLLLYITQRAVGYRKTAVNVVKYPHSRSLGRAAVWDIACPFCVRRGAQADLYYDPPAIPNLTLLLRRRRRKIWGSAPPRPVAVGLCIHCISGYLVRGPTVTGGRSLNRCSMRRLFHGGAFMSTMRFRFGIVSCLVSGDRG